MHLQLYPNKIRTSSEAYEPSQKCLLSPPSDGPAQPRVFHAGRSDYIIRIICGGKTDILTCEPCREDRVIEAVC